MAQQFLQLIGFYLPLHIELEVAQTDDILVAEIDEEPGKPFPSLVGVHELLVGCAELLVQLALFQVGVGKALVSEFQHVTDVHQASILAEEQEQHHHQTNGEQRDGADSDNLDGAATGDLLLILTDYGEKVA